MSMLNTFSTRMTVVAALAAAGGLAACGDDTKLKGTIDAHQQTFDTPVADASPADANVDAMPTAQIAGTVAVTDVTVLDSDAAAVGGIRGGSINMTFSDLTMGGGTVVAGTTQVNGCVVVKYDPTHLPNPPMDVGLIKVTNNPTLVTPNADGLLKTVGMAGNCAFNTTLKTYLCVSNAAQGTETINATNPPDSAGPPPVPPQMIVFTFPTEAATIGQEKLVGSYLMVSGFTTNTNFNSTTAYPIVGQNGASLYVLNTANTTTDGTTETITNGTYTILNGFNPVPAAGAAADFLGTGGITVEKVMATGFKAFKQDIDVPGQGFTLSDPGQPTAIPLTGTATDLTFGCGTTPSTCGDGSTTLIQATILNGRATKKAVPAHPDFYMPTEVPGTDTWLEFTCGFIGTHSATLDAAALQAIIDFAPTRVEMRVINSAGNIITDNTKPGNPQTFVIAGHALVGHTTHP